MLDVYPSLNLAQIHAALSSYYENPQEIESALQQDREVADRIESDRADFPEPPGAVVLGRFPLSTDACVNGHLVEALLQHGSEVVRAVDVYPESTPDPVVFARAAQDGRVFVSNDGSIERLALSWLGEGRSFRMVSGRRRTTGPGRSGSCAGPSLPSPRRRIPSPIRSGGRS